MRAQTPNISSSTIKESAMDASSIISPTRLNQKARAIFSRVASSEDQVVWRPRPEGGRPVRARQTRALALVTDHPVAEDFLDGRSSRYNARTAFSAVSKPCAGLHADQQIEDASRSASQMLRESFSASTLSWHQKCKPPPMTAVIERPQTVQYLRDFEVGSRRRPRTHQGSQRNRSQSFQSLQRRHREFIATEVLATHKYAEMRGENTSLSDIFTAHGLLQEDADMLQQLPSRGGKSEDEIDPSEDLKLEDQLDYDPSLDLTAQGNGHAQVFERSKSGVLQPEAPQNNPASEDMDDTDDQLITDPATIRKLRIESEREYQRRRAQEIRQERTRNQHRRWVAQDKAEELRRQSRERRDAKWQAERSVHKALQAVEKEARAKTVQSMKDAKRSLQARRQREADAWHKEQAQRVTDLRQHRCQVRSQALSSPQGGVRSPIKLKESTITAQDFLGPMGAHDLLQSSMLASSKEFPPAYQNNREILGGGFNRAAGVDRTWQRHLVHDRNF